MLKWVVTVCSVFPLIWSSQVASQLLSLTEEERAWIETHPIVRMHVPSDFKPFHYIEDGHVKGLASEYVSFIETETGLRIEPVLASGLRQERIEQFERGEVDMTAAVVSRQLPESLRARALFTDPYYATSTLVIARRNGPAVFDLRRLEGHVVAVKSEYGHESYIKAHFPAIKVLSVKSLEDALEAVVDGRAEFAMDAAPLLLSYLRNNYDDVLDVAGVISSLPVEISMGVQADLPLLYSIITKALASLTAEQTDEMVQHHIDSVSSVRPSIGVLLRYYWLYITLVLITLALVVGLALHARRQRHRALRSEKEKTMFLAVLSHEIRSPMNAILASMELLMQHASLTSESKRLLTLASSGAENLLYLLNDVLDISKLEAGRLQLDSSPVDIVQVTRSIVDLLALKANKGVNFNMQVESRIQWRLMLDPHRVGQILHNIISNALKFTDHGHVTVRLSLEVGRYSERRHLLIIHVEDTGVGIDSAALQNLFRPYSQASAGIARKFGGSGLGLTICGQLVNLMEGSIELESKLGKGTSVTIKLPCDEYVGPEPVSCSQASLQPSRPGFQAGKLKPEVLLVEDTLANQAVLQSQLDALGCCTELACTGEDALLALNRGHYDIILLDCGLPGISGYEVARRWRAVEQSSGRMQTPIVAISASSDDAHTLACFESGMDGVLKKPISLGKLRDMLQLWTSLAEAVGNDLQALPVFDPRAVMAEIWEDVSVLRDAIYSQHTDEMIHCIHRLTGAFAVLQEPDLASLVMSMGEDIKQGFYNGLCVDLEDFERLLKDYERTLLT
ncbi:transporter substrate-binding domain-containing protein [Pseudomonas sp. RW10S2]|uniref:ATP-binding protein n=1 Tax=Pseudomonas sp. RW10S2 TaxID=459637 RepID=UPI0016487F9E|nr:transporter substrate-binding domain-containing protein [Pseudomonas sp. RW10S2]MBC3467517.1 transporter substrate-binding domain-containing protein [Pseudomonas sp. RW10S2]